MSADPDQHPAELTELPRRDHDPHSIARLQIEAHGRDRYPSVSLQFMKLAEEFGELAEALLEHDDYPGPIEQAQQDARVREELADVALALFSLGNKLDIDILAAMADTVRHDLRKF